VYQIDTLILHLFTWRTLALWLCSKGNGQH
jgi:hypothetical protein